MNAAYDDSAEDLSAERRRSRRLRFELIFASLGLAFGLFLLPALIFWVGMALLGPYGVGASGEGAGLSTFYVDFYGDLSDGSGRAWIIALGPVILVYLLRAVFIGARPRNVDAADAEEARPEPRRQAAPPPRKETSVRKEKNSPPRRPVRVEPRMGSD